MYTTVMLVQVLFIIKIACYCKEFGLIVTTSSDLTIRVFDYQSVSPVACITGHKSEVGQFNEV